MAKLAITLDSDLPVGSRLNPTAVEEIESMIADSSGAMNAAIYDPTGVEADAFDRANHTGTQSADTVVDGTTNHVFTAADDTKLGGIAAGATANDTDANLKNRANHTGTQAASTISDFDTAVRANRLDQMAAPTGAINANSQLLSSVADPVGPQDAATKNYTDATIQGLQQKPDADVVATTALPAGTYSNGTSGVGATFTVTATGTTTVDGHVLAVNDIVLVTAQASGFQNGLYKVTTAGASGVATVLTRHVNMDVATEFSGAFVAAKNVGTANKNSLWLANPTTPVTVGTTSIPWTQLNSATSLTQGTGIAISGNTVSIENSGVLLPAHGGTGASSLTGLLKGNGASPATAAAAGTDYVAPGGALGTPASGTLTNAGGLPISGLVASTSLALGVGTVELGNASDTTIARSAAGQVTIEGVVIATQSNSMIMTGKTISSATNTILGVQLQLAPTAVKTANYTAAAGDLVPVDATSGSLTATLPTTPADKAVVVVTKVDATANLVIVGRGGSAKFYSSSGPTSGITLWAQGDSVTVQYNATGDFWHVLSKPKTTVRTPVWYEVHSTYAVRAVGYGANTMGFLAPDAFTLTGIVYRGETADASGSTTCEVRQNGTQITGSSKAITAANQWAYDSDVIVSGLVIAVAAGDVLRPYISAIGTTPGNGYSAVVIGYKDLVLA